MNNAYGYKFNVFGFKSQVIFVPEIVNNNRKLSMTHFARALYAKAGKWVVDYFRHYRRLSIGNSLTQGAVESRLVLCLKAARNRRSAAIMSRVGR